MAVSQELPERLELFSRTFDNRFVFSLFDLLLCGVIVFVIVKAWRSHTRLLSGDKQLLLFLAFCFLGASFGLGAVVAGAFFFFEQRLPETAFAFLTPILQSSAWLLLAGSAYQRPSSRSPEPDGGVGLLPPAWLLPSLFGLPLVGLLAAFSTDATTLLDLTNLVLLAVGLVLFRRHPLGGRHIATGAVALLLLATLLHLGSSLARDAARSVIFWNFEQFVWAIALFTFALAIGENSGDLFDRVFVRLQIAFILLASLMMLVITQTEKTDYLASIRSRSRELAEFARAHVRYCQQRNLSLDTAVRQEDFLQRITLGFGSFPELKLVRVIGGGQAASFEIARNGAIQRGLEDLQPARYLPALDPERYFPIHALSAPDGSPVEVRFYGTREFLNRHIRKRIILIFSLFTGMVAVSTFMIGVVVRGASATIHQQAKDIEHTQRQLMQASKLAAIGELAAGVAHEINNPATTILSRASFLLSPESSETSPSDREDLSAIVSQAQRIAQVTRGLLMFSHAQVSDVKAASLERVIQAGLQGVQSLLDANRIGVEMNLSREIPRVLADDQSLARALENLFRNAADAMPAGGTLSIRTVKAGLGRLQVEISDSGAGIAPETLGRIFDPFFTTKEIGKGTGLGLSIAHAIIREHRGTIAVASQPGAGTTFTIVLPTEQ